MELARDPTAGFLYVPHTHRSHDGREFYQRRFYDTEKPDYLTKVLRELDYWQALAAWRLELLAQHAGPIQRFLEIGAGAGVVLDQARRRGWQVCGIEPSTTAAAFAAEHFDLQFYRGFLEDFSGDAFDVAYSAFVLEHVPEPRAWLHHLHKLLAPGGVMWIEVPNDFNRLQCAAQQILEKDQWWVAPAHHVNYFDFDTLQALLDETGFETLARLASFPMECFPLMGLDYVGDDAVGAQCHAMRMQFELRLLKHDPDLLYSLYANFAASGLGRSCNIIARAR